jgi:hypothetical protein
MMAIVLMLCLHANAQHELFHNDDIYGIGVVMPRKIPERLFEYEPRRLARWERFV